MKNPYPKRLLLTASIFLFAFLLANTGKAQFSNCTEILNDNPSSPSGTYTIDPDQGGPLPSMECYCDMETDSGGWTLVLNYLHQASSNPQLHVFTDSLPIPNDTTLGVDESGTPAWGHADTAIMNALNFNTVRFYAKSSAHARIVHFKTQNQNTVDYFSTGFGSTSGVQSEFTAYNDHTAFLPAAINSTTNDHGNLAMTNYPLWTTSTYHWYLGPNDNQRWETDDYSLTNPSTFHQIYVRGTLTVGMEEEKAMKPLKLFPNPANNSVTIQWDENTKNALLTIQDVTGRTVRTVNASGTSTTLSTHALTNGLYFISITDANNQQLSKEVKLMVQH